MYTHAGNVGPREICLGSYDCIGFDLDHTVSTYKLKPLMNLIYKTLSSFLIEKYDYPIGVSNLSDKDFAFIQRGIILDKERGNFLKLDTQYKIVKATHGTKLLSEEDIKNTYGNNLIWNESKGVPFKLVGNTRLSEPFYVFKDFFVAPGAVVCANIVDALDERNGKPLDKYYFWDHYAKGIAYMYNGKNFKNNTGKVAPELKTSPHLYINPCSDNVKRWIKDICRNKVTFLLTSSNYDSAAFLAEYSIGKDWKNYFDVIITAAGKPEFFWKDKPFCMVNDDTEIRGVKPEEIKRNSTYIQGNWKHLQEVCSIFSKTPNPKILYFGDSLIDDICASSGMPCCDSVAIIEELSAEEIKHVPEIRDDSDIFKSDFWGSFFGFKNHAGNEESGLTLWSYLLSQHSIVTIPSLESISGLGMKDKIQCFTADARVSGFFPDVPKVLSTNQ